LDFVVSSSSVAPCLSPIDAECIHPRRQRCRFQAEELGRGQWHRSYGNELWEFDESGLMRRREASINDLAILEAERKFYWPAPGARPTDHP
jgi:nuclear transport factor 2 (NTF2) superfamily protein